MHFTPLIFESFDFAWSFSAELSPEGLIGITGSTLRIFQIPKLGTQLKQDSIPLSYTPRKFIAHGPYFYLVEGDHRVLGEDAAEKRLTELVRCSWRFYR
jgi:splicing factor 3B subunit 3